MYWVYRISSSYDGFIPSEIPNRLDNNTLVYNWAQYSDQVEHNDIIFTYFRGKGVVPGVYLISRVINRLRDKIIVGKVLRFSPEKPLLSKQDFNDEYNSIFNRPRGSVFSIPPRSYHIFEQWLDTKIISDIEIYGEVNCDECSLGQQYKTCTIFGRENMINRNLEVDITLQNIEELISPFWIFPKQSWWMKISRSQHPVSQMFYSFKSGHEAYSKLFSEGISIAMEFDDDFSDVDFDYIINIPLSPDKNRAREFDRVDKICTNLSDLTGITYVKNNLYLSTPISRREYKRNGKNGEFIPDYLEILRWRAGHDFNDKNILIVDDVITDGNTLKAFSKKFKERFPRSKIYAATCGIMAKKANMKWATIRKYQR